MLAPTLLTLATLLTAPAAAEDLLFLGNSYTQFNDLDALTLALFEEQAAAELSARKLTSGGLTFSDHLAHVQGGEEGPGKDWYLMLGEGSELEHAWVVLQEQSQIPGFPESSEYVTASRAAAVGLDAAAQAHDAQTVFFMTWGRREGDSGNADRFPDFETMQGHLTAGYLAYVAATSTEARPTWVAPVGLAFARVHAETEAALEDPLSEDGTFWQLYNADGSHPSLAGSYLAASVLTATITGADPRELSTVPAGIDPELAEALRLVAWRTVFEDTPDLAYPWQGAGGDDAQDEGGSGGEEGGTGEEGGGSAGDAGGSDESDGTGAEPLPAEDKGCATVDPAGSAGLLACLGLLGLLGRARRP